MDEVPYSLEEREPQAAPLAAEAEPAEALTLPIEGPGGKEPSQAAPLVPELVRFGPSPRALSQRRALAGALALLSLACLWLALRMAPEWGWPAWLLAAALGYGLLRTARSAASNPLAGREVLLHPQALELRRAGFRRLVVFENIRHLSIVQSRGGRLWSLRLDLEDDSVTLRDLDGLPRIFAAAAERRPAGVLIEVEELALDWGEPLPWMLLALGLALAAGLVVFFVGKGAAT
ncbi:MAG TPA: hypothetical protein VK914_04185 [bacterium]|jgi:hypothetical protein|nr:hypothetical protein [bacterium]